MKEIDGQASRFEVIAEHIGVVVLFGRGDTLLLLQLVHSGELVAKTRRCFKLFSRSRRQHARRESPLQFGLPPLQKELRIPHRLLVRLGRGESLHARAQAAMNVVLEASARMRTREIHLAAGDKKAAVNEFRNAVSEIPRKIGPVVGAAILAQAPRDEHLGIALVERELHIGISLVVAQQDIEARLALLNQVVLERERFVFVGDEDVIDVHGLAHQRSGLGIGLRSFKKIGANPGAQALGLADVDDLSFGVLVEVHAGLRRQGSDFLVEIHSGEAGCSLIRLASGPYGAAAGQIRANLAGQIRANLTFRGKVYTVGALNPPPS